MTQSAQRRHFVQSILCGAAWCVALLLVVCAYMPMVNPERWPLAGVITLFFPIALLLHLAMLVLVLLAVSILRREEDIRLFGRRLPGDLMRRACAIVIIYVSLAMLSTLAICAAQPELALEDVITEVFSAINTVGMSTGVTRELGVFARLIIILLMYAGRLGSLTFALLIARHPSPSPLRCPQERILIG